METGHLPIGQAKRIPEV